MQIKKFFLYFLLFFVLFGAKNAFAMERTQFCLDDNNQKYNCPIYLDWLVAAPYESREKLDLDEQSAAVDAAPNAIGGKAYYDPAENASDNYKEENQSVPFIVIPSNTKFFKIGFTVPNWHPSESPKFNYSQVERIMLTFACGKTLDSLTDDKYQESEEVNPSEKNRRLFKYPLTKGFANGCFCRIKINFYGSNDKVYGEFLSRPMQTCSNPPSIIKPVVKTKKAILMLGPGEMGPPAGTMFNGYLSQSGNASQVNVALDIYPSIDVKKYFDQQVVNNPEKYPNGYSGGSFLTSAVRKFSTITYTIGPIALPADNLILSSNHCYRFMASNSAGSWKGNAYCGDESIDLPQLYTNPDNLSAKLIKANDSKGASVWLIARKKDSSQYKIIVSPRVLTDDQEIKWSGNWEMGDEYCYQVRALNRAGFNAGTEYCVNRKAGPKLIGPPLPAEVKIETKSAQDPTLTSIKLLAGFSTSLSGYQATGWLWAFKVGPHIPEVFLSEKEANDFCQSLVKTQNIEKGNSSYPAIYKIGYQSGLKSGQVFGATIYNLEPNNFYCYQARGAINDKIQNGDYKIFRAGDYQLPTISIEDVRSSIANIGKDWVKITAKLIDDGMDENTKSTIIIYEPASYNVVNIYSPICEEAPEFRNNQFGKWPLVSKTDNGWKYLSQGEQGNWTIHGLVSGKTYCYQAVSVNKKGENRSQALHFAARSNLDLVQADTATQIGQNQATLNATIKDTAKVSQYWFEVNMIEGIPDETCLQTQRITTINYDGSKKVSAIVKKLCSGAKYKYQIFAVAKPDNNNFSEIVSSNNLQTFQTLSGIPKMSSFSIAFNQASKFYMANCIISDFAGNSKIRLHVRINNKNSKGECADIAYQQYFDIVSKAVPFAWSAKLDWQYNRDANYCYEATLEKTVGGQFVDVSQPYSLALFWNYIFKGTIKTQLDNPSVTSVAIKSSDRTWDNFIIRGKLIDSGDSLKKARVWFGWYFQDDRRDSKGNPYNYHATTSNEISVINGGTFSHSLNPYAIAAESKLSYIEVKRKTICYFPIASNSANLKTSIGFEQCFKFLAMPELEIVDTKSSPIGIYATVRITNDGGCGSKDLQNKKIMAMPSDNNSRCYLDASFNSNIISSWVDSNGNNMYYAFLKLKDACSYNLTANVTATCAPGGLNATSKPKLIQFVADPNRVWRYNQVWGCADSQYDAGKIAGCDAGNKCMQVSLINIGRYWYDFMKNSQSEKSYFADSSNNFDFWKAVKLTGSDTPCGRCQFCNTLSNDSLLKEQKLAFYNLSNDSLPRGTSYPENDPAHRSQLLKVLDNLAKNALDKGYPAIVRCCHATGQHFIMLTGVERGSDKTLGEDDKVYMADPACNDLAKQQVWPVSYYLEENCAGYDDCQDSLSQGGCNQKAYWFAPTAGVQ